MTQVHLKKTNVFQKECAEDVRLIQRGVEGRVSARLLNQLYAELQIPAVEAYFVVLMVDAQLQRKTVHHHHNV